jgi:hypothetical protein
MAIIGTLYVAILDSVVIVPKYFDYIIFSNMTL